MPYTKVKKNDQTCIYKADADGNAVGDSLGCHDTEQEADKQIAAILANEEDKVSEMIEVRGTIVSEFRGSFPDVPFAPGVNTSKLLGGDPDPVFVTLPVARTGAVSKNGLQYDGELVNAIIEQINGGGVSGITGHLRDDERDSAYPMPAIYWLGAIRHNGDAVAKGYIPPGAERVREHVKISKLTNGRIATSIYGRAAREMEGGNTWHAKDFQLEQLDLAPYARAALPLGDEFEVTAELKGSTEKQINKEEAKPMADKITDARDVPEAVRNDIIAEFKKEQGYEQGVAAIARVAELENEASERTARITELETAQTELTEKNEAMEAQIMEYRRAAFDATMDAIIAEAIKLEAIRPVVKRLLIAELQEPTEDAVKTALKELLESAEFKAIADAAIISEFAPRLPGSSNGTPGKEPTRAEMSEARQGWAF